MYSTVKSSHVVTSIKQSPVLKDHIFTVKPAHVVTSIKQSPVLKGHIFLVLSYTISDELNLF